MKKKTILTIMLLVVIIGISGCISGDENIDKWNTQVEKANIYVNAANTLQGEMNDAINDNNLELALEKVEEALAKYNLAKGEINNLMPIAEDLDEQFLKDYVTAWNKQVEEIMTGIEYSKKIFLIAQFNVEFDQFFTLYDTGIEQYIDAVDQYNYDNYQACSATSELAMQKWETMKGIAQEIQGTADKLGVDYVNQYADYIYSACDNAITSLQNLKLAADESMKGNWSQANDYLGQQNTFDSAFVADLNNAIQIENQHPNAFPSEGNALENLRNEYVTAKNQAEQTALSYGETMISIQNEHKDFFEE
ncbi:MAG: hypothetical protein ACXQTP_02120 [Candidatus Methanofastidiosia archaeon]